MEILNRNTFSGEEVTSKEVKGTKLVYIGKSCYSLHDLEKVITFVNKKDLNESLNYRIKNYSK